MRERQFSRILVIAVTIASASDDADPLSRSGRWWHSGEPSATGRRRNLIYRIEFGTSSKWVELLKEIAPA